MHFDGNSTYFKKIFGWFNCLICVMYRDVLLELNPCIHPTVMNDMCAECGADLRKDDLITTASIPMVHSIPELKVSEEVRTLKKNPIQSIHRL